jgi:hypothetical protein
MVHPKLNQLANLVQLESELQGVQQLYGTRGYIKAEIKPVPHFDETKGTVTYDLQVHEGELYITGRHKEILFVNGQNYYPHDLEAVALEGPGTELGKVVVSGVRPAGAEGDELVVFILHRGELAEFLPLARQVARRIGEHAGLEVSAVVPVRRIPKTTSGKVQRHLLEEEYLAGLNDADLAALRELAASAGRTARRRQRRGSGTSGHMRCGAGRPTHRSARQPVRCRGKFA